MTEQEAKKHLEARLECMNREMAVSFEERCNKNCDECNLLYAQGTIGEIKETYKMGIKALEKRIAKKPTFDDESSFIRRYHCPECKCVVDIQRYCHHCGQKLDWGNEDAE